MIYGCMWRWGENGTVAACYSEDCPNMTDEFGEPQIYQLRGGNFMNKWCIAMVLVWSLLVPCLLCACCAAISKMAGSAN